MLFSASMLAANVCGTLDATMTQSEADMARPPLARILQRMGGDTVALMEKWADPMLLLQAFMVYGQRVYGVYRREHPASSAAPVPPTTRPRPAPTNGSVPHPQTEVNYQSAAW